MSYFAAGYMESIQKIKDFENSFTEVVPIEIKENGSKFKGNSSFLLNYGPEKVIRDVSIQDKQTGSWLSLIGTPLIRVLSEDEALLFIDRFFENPKKTIIDEIDGSFAVLAYNARRNIFYAAVDYNNTIPIYYAVTPKGILYSSHELQLARVLQSEIDPLGFSQTIHLKLTWGAQTRFKNIYKLDPCQLITFSSKTKKYSEQYWCPSEETQWPNNFDDTLDKWLTIMKESVQSYYDCSNNKTIICDFTAGEDSRLLLALCYNLGIPFQAKVNGGDNDIDVIVAREAARKTGFDLIVQEKPLITDEQLLGNATFISLINDAYQDYFKSSIDYATDRLSLMNNYKNVNLCGAPGGEAFRGSYYLRGKAFFPSMKGHFDHHFFVNLKYLLDFYPGLLTFSDEDFKESIFKRVEEALEKVKQFPVGIKIDHLLRMFQTCNSGLIYKNPRYLPFATKRMTHSIYNLSPSYKKGGRLTKACTEKLYPKLAFIKNQKGVPTIRKTLLRTPLFIPEFISVSKGIFSGAVSRLYRLKDSNKPIYQWSENAPAVMTLLNTPPYSKWFSSADNMITGQLYNNKVVESLFSDAKAGSSKFVPILGRIISQELAGRWVYQKKA